MSENTTINNTAGNDKLTVNYILEQLEKIRTDTEYLHQAISQLGQLGNAQIPGDVAGAAKAEALGNVVKCRETTNQKLIAFYEKLYSELNPQYSMKERAFFIVERMDKAGQLSPEDFNMILDNLRHMEL